MQPASGSCSPVSGKRGHAHPFGGVTVGRDRTTVGRVERPAWASEDIDVTRPNVARMYDAFLGGSHNFAADRDMVAQLTASWPETPRVARANRAFLRRVVRYLLDAGVRQFLDLGSGIPTVGNVHEITQARSADTRVVYVDVDPVAVAHSRALLVGNPHTAVIQADLCQPQRILSDPALTELLDLTQPVAVLLVSVLHFIPDPQQPQAAVHTLSAAIPPGSWLALSHATYPRADVELADELANLYQKRTRTSGVLRSPDEILTFFDGYELIEPGLVDLPQWHPDGPPNPGESYHDAVVLAGLGRRH
jgi:hypothetical protein